MIDDATCVRGRVRRHHDREISCCEPYRRLERRCSSRLLPTASFKTCPWSTQCQLLIEARHYPLAEPAYSCSIGTLSVAEVYIESDWQPPAHAAASAPAMANMSATAPKKNSAPNENRGLSRRPLTSLSIVVAGAGGARR